MTKRTGTQRNMLLIYIYACMLWQCITHSYAHRNGAWPCSTSPILIGIYHRALLHLPHLFLASVDVLWSLEAVNNLFRQIERRGRMNSGSDKHIYPHPHSLMHPQNHPLLPSSPPIWQRASFRTWWWSKRKLISKELCLLFPDMKYATSY